MRNLQKIWERVWQVAFGAYLLVGSVLFFYFVALTVASITNTIHKMSEVFGGNPLPVLHIIGL